MNIFKLSISTEFFSKEEYDLLKAQNALIIHPDSKPLGQSTTPQSDVFKGLAIGDIVFICRSNISVDSIVMINDSRIYNSTLKGKEDWICKNYITLFEGVDKSNHSKDREKWWSPSFNSTFAKVKGKDFNQCFL